MNDARQILENVFGQFLSAVENGNIEEMKSLYRNDFMSRTSELIRLPIHVAALHGQLAALKWLLEHGADVNSETENKLKAIHCAAHVENTEILRSLVIHGAKVDSSSDKGYTPIHYAALNGHTSTMKWLKKNGANIFCKNSNKWTPVFCAAANGHVEALQWLLNHGLDVNDVDDWDKSTPMHLAAENGHVEIVKLLADKGANIEAENQAKWRPLHKASSWGRIDVLRWLLAAGCVVDAKNADKRTPMDLADLMNENDCKKELQDAQERRKKDKEEFQIFHFKELTVIYRKYKIYDPLYVAQKMSENVLPLNRPVLFCDSFNIQNCLSSDMIVVPLNSDKFYYQEFVVFSRRDNDETIKSILSGMRSWTIEHKQETQSIVGKSETSRINLQIKSLKSASNWKDRVVIKFNLHDEGEDRIKETIFLSVLGSLLVSDVKTIFINSLKFFYSLVIQETMNLSSQSSEESVGNAKLSDSIEKLILARIQLMTFYDKGKHKLPNSKAIKEVVNAGNEYVTVEQKYFGKMEFKYSTSDTILSFASQDSIIVNSVVLGPPTIILLRKDYHSSIDIKNAITEHTKISGRVGLVSKTSIIVGDVNIVELDDVIHYFIVLQFEEQTGYKKLRRIGAGAFGCVYGCRVQENDSNFVVKEIIVSEDDDKEYFEVMVNEILVACRIGIHPRIMKWVNFFEDDCAFYILMHRMKMSLSGYIEKNKPLKENKIIFFTQQILQGLEYLHDNKIIHRDIKGMNILLDKYDNVKLTDFGISKCLKTSSSKALCSGGQSTNGTYNWMAPEVMDGDGKYGLQCDVWSVGATVVQMITGQIPFHGMEQQKVISTIKEKRKIDYKYPADFREDLKKFVESCLMADPSKRPDCKKLLEYSIFK